MDIIQIITKELSVEKWQVEAAVKLIDEGCTIPFISRYRKEATGSLNDEQLRSLHELSLIHIQMCIRDRKEDGQELALYTGTVLNKEFEGEAVETVAVLSL